MLRHSLRLVVAFVTYPLAACDRPEPIGSGAPSRAAAAPKVGPASPLPASELATRYASASDADQRRESLYALHETPAAEALPALARMWDAETDPDLQIELLDSLAVFTSGADAKVALLERVFSAHASPGDVKDAALDALLDIQDPAAVRLWQRLANDPSPEVRDLARTTLAEIAALDASD